MEIIINEYITIPDSSCSWVAMRSSGPGGQNVNKVSSKIRFFFDLPNCGALNGETKHRLSKIASKFLDSDGKVVIDSQIFREQSKNLEYAIEKLKDLIRKALVKPKLRVPTKPTKTSKAKRVEIKRIKGIIKKRRSEKKFDQD
ncbi:MAG: aminoacyl-tRNA hydrolase [Candidatus Riflebacteria bacterium]|nr:aminoacyl-tRNA hydrolase [Candidatus Riflebacteria bacterium]